jgi:hypothetical protein
MDVRKYIEELRGELERITELIRAMEKYQEGKPRRGRPPGSKNKQATKTEEKN